MSDHEGVRIKFSIRDRNYEAVGFLRGKEFRVNGEEMLRRVAGDNGGAIGEDERVFLGENIALFPMHLSSYVLATNIRPNAEDELDRTANKRRDVQVLCFGFSQGGWQRSWGCVCSACDWQENELVIRRCP